MKARYLGREVITAAFIKNTCYQGKNQIRSLLACLSFECCNYFPIFFPIFSHVYLFKQKNLALEIEFVIDALYWWSH